MLRCLQALTLALLSSLAPPAAPANNYPIVLIHGFLGFGPEQFKNTGFKYWGGFDDIAGHMRTHHGRHTVLVTSVGSISSSWDRSAELYYQIKGGCVDYGRIHTIRFQHLEQRRPPGKCWAADPANNPHGYPLALYPAWDARHPVHLIGHSQGGQTMRSLIELLENGSPHGDEGGGDLYQGGKIGWVISATSIAAPHNGTSLRDAMGYLAPAALDLATGIARTADPAPGRRGTMAPGRRYLEMLASPPLWNQENFDSAQFEMGPDGARNFNAWVKTSPHVYYFSVANSATESGAWCCNQTDRVIAPFQNPRYHYPRADMGALTRPYAGEWILPLPGRRGLGSYTQTDPARVLVDSAWFRNDGVVNTVSMRAPAGHPVRDYDGTPVRGSWNFLQHYRTYDHFDVLGWPRSGPKAYPIYDAITAILFAL